jgi:hypothetical protein
VGSRFDDWIYWTSLLQLQLIMTVDTLNSYLITNLSLYSFWFLDWSLVSRLLLLSTTDGLSAMTHCSAKFLSFHHFARTVSKSPPSTVPVLCLSALCWIPCINSGKGLIGVFVAARRVLTIRCLATVYSALPRERTQRSPAQQMVILRLSGVMSHYLDV